jgi:hypothetical protein
MRSVRGYPAGAHVDAEIAADEQSSGIVRTVIRIGWVILAVLAIVVPALSWPERIGQLSWLETMATWF